MSSDLRECFFWGLCKPVIASIDVWPQEMFAFFEIATSGRSLAWACQQAVSVPSRTTQAFVLGGLWDSMHTCLLFLSFNILRHGEGCVPYFFDYFEKQKLLSDREIESFEGTHYTSMEGSSSHTRSELLGRFCKPNFGSNFEKVRVRFRQGRVGVLLKKSNRIFRSANRIFFFRLRLTFDR